MIIPHRVVIRGTTPITARLDTLLPGPALSARLLFWELNGGAPVPTDMMQLHLPDLPNMRQLVSGCRPSTLQVPFKPGGLPWEGQPIEMHLADPIERFTSFRVRAYADGEPATEVVGATLSIWLDFMCNVREK
jgi:hypothetical protein